MKRDGATAGMSGGRPARGNRLIPRPAVPPGPLRTLKSLVYEGYVAAGAPTLDEMARAVAADDELKSSPSRDTINRLIGDAAIPAKQADVVALVTVLTRMTGGDGDQPGRDAAALWTQTQLAEPLGRPIADISPYELEVHHAIAVQGGTGLPAYVERAHDAELRRIVSDSAQGSSHLVMLVGTSSTGKTRACFEAVQHLPYDWRLWHPINPERPQAALADLDRVGPKTVIWLNEAHHYLLNPQHGEPIAAGLRTLLADTTRAPVLILGTIWPGPGYYEDLRATPPREDPHAQARVLLAGRTLHVPPAFAPSEVARLKKSGDPRLATAASSVQDGKITQYLAAGFELTDLYNTATPGPRALLDAAMDARRLGHPIGLPLPFLAVAAEGYLTDTEWDLLADNWLEQSLLQLTSPVKGARGPLHPQKRPRGMANATATATGQMYRLADFLEDHGRASRRLEQIPALFWQAALQHCEDEAARSLASAAEARGLMQTACRLWAKGAAYAQVANALEAAGRPEEAFVWFERAAAGGDTYALRRVSNRLARSGRVEEALAWLERAAAESDAYSALTAADLLLGMGRVEEAQVWFERTAADGDAYAALVVADRLAAANRLEEALVWFKRAAAAGDGRASQAAAHLLKSAGRMEEAQAWLQHAAADDTPDMTEKAAQLARSGRIEEALVWFEHAASEGDADALLAAADWLAEAGRVDEALVWFERAAAAGDTGALRAAANKLATAGRMGEALSWFERAAASGDASAHWVAADRLAAAGHMEEALVWFERAAAAGNTLAPLAAADWLAEAGRVDEALVWFERAAAAGNTEALRAAANKLIRSGRVDDAVSWFERAAGAGDISALSAIGEVLASAGRIQEALVWFERAAAAGDSSALLKAANKLMDASRPDDARVWAQNAVAAGDTHAFRWMANRLAEAGRAEEALVWFTRAASAGDTDALQARANQLTLAGRVDEALVWFERAAAAGDISALLTAANLLIDANHLEKALAWLQRATIAGAATRSLAVRVLRRQGRSADAEQLERYGWDYGGHIAAPWRMEAPPRLATHP
ncbi:hypothetical protein [Streptomyces mirabilis]